MSNKEISYYLNFTANILVVVTATMLIGLLAYHTLLKPSLNTVEAELLKAGTNFTGLQEFDFGKTPNTILFVTNINCQYNSQAIPFYKKIIARSKGNSAIRILAVFSNKKEKVENFMREHQLDTEFIEDTDLLALKVDATPTLIWVDANRKIVGSYQGVLQEKQEAAFFEVYEKRLYGIKQ
jgi:hypothetical protein